MQSPNTMLMGNTELPKTNKKTPDLEITFRILAPAFVPYFTDPEA